MSQILGDFRRVMEAQGWKTAVVSINRLEDIKRDMEAVGAGDFHTGYIDWWARCAGDIAPKGLPFTPCSLIIVAAPSPVCSLRFTHAGETVETSLPPTYADYNTKNTEAERTVNEFLAPLGFQASLAHTVPNKLLAVRCGLGRYGRNNICYVDGLGSYAGLYALYADLPCADDVWYPVRRMERCDGCHACAEACPTAAIDRERTIINADICITSFNEGRGEFPEWLAQGSHNCLVGCMRCQGCCPANKENAGFVTDGCVFDERETECILSHKAGEPYPEDIAAKLTAIGIYAYHHEQLPRNLRALLGLQSA